MKNSRVFDLVVVSPQKSMLNLSGMEKTIDVPGSVLEAQTELQNGWYLILTTENSPYDEALHVTLFDQSFGVLDQVELSQDMTPGVVKDIQIMDGQSLKFYFNRADPYTLKVDASGFLLPASFDYARRNFFKKLGRKYLRII